MSEDDPLAALSAAAKRRSAPSAMPRQSFNAPRRARAPQRKSSYLVPLLIALGVLAIGVPAGILITMKLLAPPPPPPKIHVIIKDAPVPGELFAKVHAQDMTPSKPAPDSDNTPPPDPPQ